MKKTKKNRLNDLYCELFSRHDQSTIILILLKMTTVENILSEEYVFGVLSKKMVK